MKGCNRLFYQAIFTLLLLLSGNAFSQQYVVVDSCDDYEDYNCECFDDPYNYCVYYPDASDYPSSDYYIDFGATFYSRDHHHREQSGPSGYHLQHHGSGGHGASHTQGGSTHSSFRSSGDDGHH